MCAREEMLIQTGAARLKGAQEAAERQSTRPRAKSGWVRADELRSRPGEYLSLKKT